jgi:hypothetical protein
MHRFVEFVERTLMDEHGISEDAFRILCDLANDLPRSRDKESIQDMISYAKSWNDRFYLPRG